MTEQQPEPPAGEDLGRLVHQVRLAHNAELERPFFLDDWEERSPRQQELDMRIGSALAARGAFDELGRTKAAEAKLAAIGTALREHYLAGISCDHARKEDNPVCACSRVFLGWHPSVGEAVEAWIGHVMEVAGGEGEAGNG